VESDFGGGNPIFQEAFDQHFIHSGKDVVLCGGILRQNGTSEITCSLKNISGHGQSTCTVTDLAERELLERITLAERFKPTLKSAKIIDEAHRISEKRTKTNRYLLIHYFPSLPYKGQGFHSIYQTQQQTYINLLETLEFFYGHKSTDWMPDHSGMVKEVYEYQGRHKVKWIHSVRKLMSADFIFFVGTSLLAKQRPIVELKVLYSRAGWRTGEILIRE
jgi:hypothetical protein